MYQNGTVRPLMGMNTETTTAHVPAQRSTRRVELDDLLRPYGAAAADHALLESSRRFRATLATAAHVEAIRRWNEAAA